MKEISIAERFIQSRKEAKVLTVGEAMSEKMAQAYPAWWINKSGKAYPVHSHIEGAQEILTEMGQPLSPQTDIADAYQKMYSLGFSRVMLMQHGMDEGFHIDHAPGISISSSQKNWLIEQAKSRQVPVFDDVTNRVLVTASRKKSK